MTRHLTIAIDFDGTIVQNAYPDIGPLQKHVKPIMHWIREQGHVIIINTCRAETHADEAKAYLIANNIPFDYFNENDPARSKIYGSDTRKISADLYIDDKDMYGLFHGIDWLKIAVAIKYLQGIEP